MTCLQISEKNQEKRDSELSLDNAQLTLVVVLTKITVTYLNEWKSEDIEVIHPGKRWKKVTM